MGLYAANLGLWIGLLLHRRRLASHRITYTLMLIVLAVSLLTGLAMYKPAQLWWLMSLFAFAEPAGLSSWQRLRVCHLATIPAIAQPPPCPRPAVHGRLLPAARRLRPQRLERGGGGGHPAAERTDRGPAAGKGPVPEFRRSQVQPDALLVNSFNGTPRLAPDHYRLVVNGAVRRPLRLDPADLAALPQRECVIRHVCVEGWAAIVAWSGPRLADVLSLAGPSPLGAYLAIRSADQSFETWDLASVLHPQTLLATHMNGAPLPVANGAPVRLASPIKLGYKQSKSVIGLELMTTLGDRLGTWEDQGYEWFAGL